MRSLAVLALALGTSALEPGPSLAEYWGNPYRSPYRYYYSGPGYRQQTWGIPRQGYFGPRWQRDPYWIYRRWRGGW